MTDSENELIFHAAMKRMFLMKGRDATAEMCKIWWAALKDFEYEIIIERLIEMGYESSWPTVDAVLDPLREDKKLIAENDYQRWCAGFDRTETMRDMMKQNPGWERMDEFDKKRFMCDWYKTAIVDDVDKIIAKQKAARLGVLQVEGK